MNQAPPIATSPSKTATRAKVRNYPALTTIRIVLLAFAGIVFALTLYATVASVVADVPAFDNPDAKDIYLRITLFATVFVMVSGLLATCLIVAFAESIKLAIDIQQNTQIASWRR